MIFIVGGAYQGKRKYAALKYNISEKVILNGSVCDIDDVYNAVCISEYHELVKRLICSGISPEKFTNDLIEKNKNAVIIMNEIGCGIVPIDRKEREWREAAGRCGCIIASGSETVIRIVCGMPHEIKGETD